MLCKKDKTKIEKVLILRGQNWLGNKKLQFLL